MSGTGDVARDPSGITCGTGCAAYPVGTQISLTARPAAGHRFEGWSGACAGTQLCTLKLSSSTKVGASFVAVFTLSLTKAGTGSGTVTSTPPGIACGPSCPSMSVPFDSGTTVTLVAAPSAGSAFVGWQGACAGTADCTVAMTAERSVVATFARTVATLTLVIGGLEGSVSSAPAGVRCDRPPGTAGTLATQPPTVCAARFAPGTQITLTPAGPYPAVWRSGCAPQPNGACVLKLDADMTVRVDFVHA